MARSEYLTKIKSAGKVTFDEIVKTKMRIYQTMYENAYSQTKIPAERYLANAIHKRVGYIEQTENESLDASLKILAIQIQDRDSFLQKFPTEISNEYKKFSEAELKVLIQIRREMKNEKLKR